MLKEYWSIVYRGKDIDEVRVGYFLGVVYQWFQFSPTPIDHRAQIFIRAEKATSGAKSYDYRVVMKQGDTG